MEHREQKRGRLARARLRLTRDILALERDRQRLTLNRGALGKPGVGDAPLQSCR
jgi:hypothetical protein